MNGSRHWRLAPPRAAGGRGWPAGLMSLLLHGGLALALLGFVRIALPPAPPEPLAIEVLVVAAAPPPAAPEPPAEPAPPPVAEPVQPAPAAPAPAPKRVAPRPAARPAPAAAPAPEPVAGPAPPAAVATTIDPGWRNSFASWLATHRVYPAAARRDGTEGHATIRVVIARDGQVLEAEMLEGTGSAVLDRAVGELLAAARAARFPFPDGMAQARIAQTVTLRYALAP